MQNKTWMKCLGVALAMSMTVVGCGSSSGSSVADSSGSGASTGTGGSSSSGGGTGSGTSSVGLTGGSGSGSTGPVTTGGGNSTGGSTGGNTGGNTGGDTGGTTGNLPFNRELAPEAVVEISSLSNPTQMVHIGSRTFMVEGFGLGNNGAVVVSSFTTVNNVPTLTDPVRLTAAPGSPLSAVLSNPFGLATDGTDLFVSVGFNNFGNGGIIKISNITITGSGNAVTATANFENITDSLAGSTIPNNPAFMFITDVDGDEYIYWSEYAQQNSSGGVRRIRTSPAVDEIADTVANGLNFPAGIATDGTHLIIADSAGGQASLGQVVRVPLSHRVGDPPSTPTTANVVKVAQGEQAITRPFDIAYDGVNGFFWTEGNAIEGTVGITSSGTASGTVRYLPRGTDSVSRVVVNGVTNGSGIDAIDLGGGNVGILYSESIALNGRVLRGVYNVNTPGLITPNVVDTGLDRPLDVAIGSAQVPIFSTVINYNGGPANGQLRMYAP